jgi:[calcium/calmodulin-dependent protein kinase] kinase
LLQPPSTIISPPSPIDSTHSIPIVSSPAAASSTPGSQEQELQYESPEEDEETEVAPSPRPKPTRRPRSADDSLNAKPMAADALSVSPSRDSSLLLPVTPDAEGNPTIPRPPSPSSPHYRPKPHHHRRTSSTHRVRETVHGEQRNTEDGERMVNQYRIGKSLGKGAYATVELGVDVGTGEEYVSRIW